ncbi:MAG: septum site-determining protein MinC [Chloroflexi bacterium]|nr:septum site-determining protein MinC [Chloroflexota bacterium]MCI0576623.1 septum site-determining protein MinC [Chloroflexota bacterium]MCI0647009.1 septum site-determining protein MinC [Chloroflexota bacterium]MCI0730709.1 septum site-determining protein MinC [Chloroflexota bacterium]
MGQQNARPVTIKGIREGLLITAESGPYEAWLGDLTAEVAAKGEFLRGSRVALAVGDQALTRSQLAEVQALLAGQGLALWAILAEAVETKNAARDLGLATRLPGSNTDLDGNNLAALPRPEATPTTRPAPPEPAAGPGGLLLKETLRSGRSVYHEGHVVVIGDVNPGAEIIAGGDVVVWGKLRGLVHAGALGNTGAVICALELIPTQLRIADHIAISPPEQRRQPVPEMVCLRNGRIVAEAWRPGRD